MGGRIVSKKISLVMTRHILGGRRGRCVLLPQLVEIPLRESEGKGWGLFASDFGLDDFPLSNG